MTKEEIAYPSLYTQPRKKRCWRDAHEDLWQLTRERKRPSEVNAATDDVIVAVDDVIQTPLQIYFFIRGQPETVNNFKQTVSNCSKHYPNYLHPHIFLAFF